MRRRILTSIFVVIIATIVTLGVPLSIVSWRLVDDLTHQELGSRLESISQDLTEQISSGHEVTLDRLSFLVPDQGRLLITTSGRNVQAVGDRIEGDAITEKLAMTGGGELKLSVPADTVRAEQYEALVLVGVAVLLSIVVGTVVAIITARRLANPMTDVAGRAARLGAGDFRTSSRRFGITELDRICEVLDSSATDIAALIRRERDLASDVSHQLRTRLTGLRLRLEELAMHPDRKVAEESSAALEQADRLVTIVDDLLAAARSRRAAGATELTLATELDAVRAEWHALLADARRRLLITCPPDVVVHATGGRLREAFGVLVDNALRHGAGDIRIVARPERSMMVAEVSDSGRGVDDAMVGHIFDRGVSTVESTGIGLGLARALIEADGGRIELRRARPPVFGVFLVPGDRDDQSGSGPPADPASADSAASGVAISSGNTNVRYDQ